MKRFGIQRWLLVVLLQFLLIACTSTANSVSTQSETEGMLKVVATTTIVADVVSQVGGNEIEVSTLIPPGSDPHSYEPTPQDIAKVDEADVVFANGAGLEEFLDKLIESAGAQDRVVHVSDGIDFILTDNVADPHTWTDPNNVMIWARNIEEKLSDLDAANAQHYQANAHEYQAKLKEMDAWMRGQVEQIPLEERQIVTDHKLFGYFARRYGFEQIGAIIPGYSTMASPSAKELAELEDAIKELGVKAILVGNTVNPDLAQRVSEDTGAELVFIYTGSLSDTDGEAPTYLDYLRYNVEAILRIVGSG